MHPPLRERGCSAAPSDVQGVIMNLQRYWGDQGCVVLQPYDNEVGAGTNAPATTLALAWPRHVAHLLRGAAAVRRTSRYGENPNRTQHYFQFQVLMKPSPDNIQELYLGSLRAIGIDVDAHDVRFVEDDWESPTLGPGGWAGKCGSTAWK